MKMAQTGKWNVMLTNKEGKKQLVCYNGFKTKKEAQEHADRANAIEGITAEVIKQ